MTPEPEQSARDDPTPPRDELTPQRVSTLHESSSTGMSLFSHFEHRPENYLRFANQDISEPDSPRTRINSLGNAKRALHMQVDLLSDALGFQRWPARRSGFPARLQFLGRFGLVTPRIVAKVNGLRNRVEHDYHIPDREVVEDYIDVVGLYLDATDKQVRSFTYIRSLLDRSTEPPTDLCLFTQRGSGELRIYECDLFGFIRSQRGFDGKSTKPLPELRWPAGIDPILSISLSKQDAKYFEWAQILLGN